MGKAINREISMSIRSALLLLAALALGACAVPPPYRAPSPTPTPAPAPAPESRPPAETQPVPEQPPVDEVPPPPAPVVREPVLSPASRALVSQAQSQLAAGNYAVAASSIE